jgi:hypothetical protein
MGLKRTWLISALCLQALTYRMAAEVWGSFNAEIGAWRCALLSSRKAPGHSLGYAIATVSRIDAALAVDYLNSPSRQTDDALAV